jgi:hypothetical protein
VTLKPNTPVDTAVPALQVAGMALPGKYTFQLVVIDDLGNVSKPATFTVSVTAG